MDFILYKHIKQCMNWLLPAQCFACDAELSNAERSDTEHYLCETCAETLPYMPHHCFRCGQAFSGEDGYCGTCLSQPPTFDSCFCGFEYESPINASICQLKYGQHPQVARTLASLFLAQIKAHDIALPEALIPVPMHKHQLRIRGFNQSLELAKHIGHQLNIPVITGALVKRKPTQRQATQTLKQRKNNVKGSFEQTRKITQKHIAIVDDVVTTGTTAEEIAKILKKNGVDYVQVWGIARTR